MLLLRLALRGIHLEASRIERFDETVDHRALAGSAEAFKGDDHRNSLFLAEALQAAQLGIQLAHQRLKFLFVHLLRKINFF